MEVGTPGGHPLNGLFLVCLTDGIELAKAGVTSQMRVSWQPPGSERRAAFGTEMMTVEYRRAMMRELWRETAS